ncbi:MAG: hypothetical protein RL497_204 [Pseudomonadota bacterium]|jgi:TonB-dependent receptor
MLKRTKLSSAIVSLMATTMFSSIPAFAEDAGGEEIVVTGIRASLDKSMDIKKEASGVVDAISAEDIGKMPDTNLAESLARITGVSIDRANGEGFQVTARGFGPQFNLITLNGRTMPSTQLNPVGGLVNNRAFDMSNIASEGVAGVDVYKTGRASIASGGIGAAINLKTSRPLDAPGLKLSVGGKALMDTSNRIGSDMTPELSGFASWTDEAEMFGASFSFSHQERDSAQSGVYVNNWSDYSAPYYDSSFFTSTAAGAARVVDAPSKGQLANTPNGVRYIHGDYERTRDNMQLTLQYKPADNITTTLDYTSAQQESFVNRAELSFWFGGGTFPVTDAQFHKAPVATPKYIWLEQGAGAERDLGITQSQGNVQNNLESLGFNAEWEVSDALKLTFDAHSSSSESLPADGAMANWFNIALGARGVSSQGFTTEGDLPLLVGVYQDTNGGKVPGQFDVGDLGSTVRQVNFDRSVTDVSQVQVSGRFEFDDNAAVDFGLSSSSMENVSKSSFSQILLEGGWGVSKPGDVPADMMEELNFASLFSGYSTSLSPAARAFYDASGKQGKQATVFTKGFIAKDAAQLGKLLSANAKLAWAPDPNDTTNRTISEDVTALFGQLDLKTDLGDMPLDILTGVRYEKTTVDSKARIAKSTIEWQGDNDFKTNAGSIADAPLVSGVGDYHNVLPSMDVTLHVTDEIIGRVSASKTIARPDLDKLQQGIGSTGSPGGGPLLTGLQIPSGASITGTIGTSSDGNPGLKPLESSNFDLSVEWYYDKSSYVSVGFFNKDVVNFLGDAQIRKPAAGTLDPTSGPRAQAALDKLKADGIAVTQQNLFMMMAALSPANGPGCVKQKDTSPTLCGAPFGSATYEGANGYEDNVNLYGVAGDPDILNTVRTPVNAKQARLTGWELAAQHFFGETGFGVSANYTIVNGSVGFDIKADPGVTQFALTGLSDSANLALIYENYGFSGRIVYNWRDKFLDNAAVSRNEPQFTEEYSQIDFTAGYKFNDSFSIALEGINILEEDKRQHGRDAAQLTRLEILGARYALSGRYTY